MTDTDALTRGLRAAIEAVDAAGVPGDLREIAFARALDATLGPTRPAPDKNQVQHNPRASAAAAGGLTEGVRGDDSVRSIAVKLGLDVETAAKMYEVDADGLHLVLFPEQAHLQSHVSDG